MKEGQGFPERGYMGKIFSFLKEARAELQKVTWPSWEEVNRSTVVVFIAVVLFTLFIYLADVGISYIMTKVLG